MSVAETILNQISRNARGRFSAMTGARDFVASENSVQFKIGGGAKQRINKVRIVLDPTDTYTVEFWRVGKAGAVKVVEARGVYADSLTGVFEHYTGLRTSL